jgi:thiamine-phosphate pyrophosphorylase
MIFKKNLLYILSDTGFEHISYFKHAIESKVDIIQLRDKKLSDREFYQIGLKIKELAVKNQIWFIIDDRIDIARAIDADGVHLGEKDMPIKEARNILGNSKIIGYSTHNLNDALHAFKEGADYISVGPIFKSSSKPDLSPISRKEISLINEKIFLPKIAIGGINLDNIDKVKEMGFRKIAVVSSFNLAEDKKGFIKKMREALENDIN